MSIDVKKFSKLANMKITQEQMEMLEDYIPKAIELCDKLLKIDTSSLENASGTMDYQDLRDDNSQIYDQIQNLEFTVPRMVNKS